MNPGKAPHRASISFQHSPPRPPQLHDVSDPDRVAVFNPDGCADRGEWIQIDRRHAVTAEDAR